MKINMNHPTTTVDVAQSTDELTPIDVGVGVDEPTLENSLADAREAENVIIGLTAMPCSGKSTVVDLMNVLGVQSVCMGDVVREVAETTLTNDPWKTAQQLRNQRPDEIARRTRGAVERALDEDGLVVVDGLRSEAERQYYETSFDATFVLVEVFCDDTTRVERYGNDRDVEWSTAVDELCERDERELDVGLGELLESSDTTILNDWNTSYTELMDQVERLVNDVRGQ